MNEISIQLSPPQMARKMKVAGTEFSEEEIENMLEQGRYFLNLVLDTALQNWLASLVDAIASSKVLKLSLTDPLTGDI